MAATTNLMSIIYMQSTGSKVSSSTRSLETVQRQNNNLKSKNNMSNNKSFGSVFNEVNDSSNTDYASEMDRTSTESVQDLNDPINAAIKKTSAHGKSKNTQDAPQNETQPIENENVNEIEEDEDFSNPKITSMTNDIWSFVSMDVDEPVIDESAVELVEDSKPNLMTILPQSQEADNKSQDMLNLLSGQTWKIKPQNQTITQTQDNQVNLSNQNVQFVRINPTETVLEPKISSINVKNSTTLIDELQPQQAIQIQQSEEKVSIFQNIPLQRPIENLVTNSPLNRQLALDNLNQPIQSLKALSQTPLQVLNQQTQQVESQVEIQPGQNQPLVVQGENLEQPAPLLVNANDNNQFDFVERVTSVSFDTVNQELKSVQLTQQTEPQHQQISQPPQQVNQQLQPIQSQPQQIENQPVIQNDNSIQVPVENSNENQTAVEIEEPIITTSNELGTINQPSQQIIQSVNQQVQQVNLQQPIQQLTKSDDNQTQPILQQPDNFNQQLQTQNQNLNGNQPEIVTQDEFDIPNQQPQQINQQMQQVQQPYQGQLKNVPQNQSQQTVLTQTATSEIDVEQPLQESIHNTSLDDNRKLDVQPRLSMTNESKVPNQQAQQINQQIQQVTYQPQQIQLQQQQIQHTAPASHQQNQPVIQSETIEVPQAQAVVAETQPEILTNRQQLNQINTQNQFVVEAESDNSQIVNSVQQSSQQQSQNNSQQQNLQSAMQQSNISQVETEEAAQSQTSTENFAHNLGAALNNNNNIQTTNTPTDPVNQAAVTARDDFNITGQIVEHAKMIRTLDNTEMVIHLKPEHLGELTLRVSVTSNGAVNASFHSENAQVRAMIENSLTQLKNELSNQGLKVDNVQVSAHLSDGGMMNGKGQQAWEQNQRGNNNNARIGRINNINRTSSEIEDTAAEVVASTVENTATADGVDYRV